MPTDGLFDFSKGYGNRATVLSMSLIADVTARDVIAITVNNCFSSAYDNYRIFGQIFAWSANGNVTGIRYVNGDGVYAQQEYDCGLTYGTGSSRITDPARNITYVRVGYPYQDSQAGAFIMDVINPAVEARTQTQHNFMAMPVSGTATNIELANSQTRVTNKFTGFQFMNSVPHTGSGTTLMSARLSVYGYRNP